MKAQMIELNEKEVSALIQSLSKQPYEDVADLIAKIKSQCEGTEEAPSERVDFDS